MPDVTLTELVLYELMEAENQRLRERCERLRVALALLEEFTGSDIRYADTETETALNNCREHGDLDPPEDAA